MSIGRDRRLRVRFGRSLDDLDFVRLEIADGLGIAVELRLEVVGRVGYVVVAAVDIAQDRHGAVVARDDGEAAAVARIENVIR